jgi:hypothetical protein
VLVQSHIRPEEKLDSNLHNLETVLHCIRLVADVVAVLSIVQICVLTIRVIHVRINSEGVLSVNAG